jgi:hypothetical protein
MIIFDPHTHTYRHHLTNDEYISVTTLLNKFKKPFDVITASERVAKREGTTPDEVRKKWKQINDESKQYGTKIHNVIDLYNTSKSITPDYEHIIDSYNKLQIINDEDKLLSEERVHSHTYKVAGTADVIKIEPKGKFSIFDIKTNKKFNFFNTYGEKLLPPLSHLQACELTTYSLQLSLYAFMYQEMTGSELNQLGILYYNRENNTFVHYPVVYMKRDITKILEFYGQSKLG